MATARGAVIAGSPTSITVRLVAGHTQHVATLAAHGGVLLNPPSITTRLVAGHTQTVTAPGAHGAILVAKPLGTFR